MNNNFIPYVKTLSIKNCNNKTDKYMCKLVELLLFNIVSVGAIFAVINNSSSIDKKYTKNIYEFICDKINIKKSLSGGNGTGFPLEYFGIKEDCYKVENEGTDKLTVDFEKGIARPQIGGNHKYFIINKYMDQVIYFYQMKISNKSKEILIKIFNKLINCIIKEINKSSTNNIIIIKKYIKKLI